MSVHQIDDPPILNVLNSPGTCVSFNIHQQTCCALYASKHMAKEHVITVSVVCDGSPLPPRKKSPPAQDGFHRGM